MDAGQLEHSLHTDADIVSALLIEGRHAEADEYIERSGHARRLQQWRAHRETRTGTASGPFRP